MFATILNLCCPTISHFQHITYSCNLCLPILCKHEIIHMENLYYDMHDWAACEWQLRRRMGVVCGVLDCRIHSSLQQAGCWLSQRCPVSHRVQRHIPWTYAVPLLFSKPSSLFVANTRLISCHVIVWQFQQWSCQLFNIQCTTVFCRNNCTNDPQLQLLLLLHGFNHLTASFPGQPG